MVNTFSIGISDCPILHYFTVRTNPLRMFDLSRFRAVRRSFSLYIVLPIAALTALGQPVVADYVLAKGSEVAPLKMFKDCGNCPEMIALPMGTFTMGAPFGEESSSMVVRDGVITHVIPDDPDYPYFEGPQHRAEIDIRIAMGRNETTYEEWIACEVDGCCGGYVPDTRILRTNQNIGRGEIPQVKGKHPAIRISHLDVMEYATRDEIWSAVTVDTGDKGKLDQVG